jgi:hypothetical protein
MSESPKVGKIVPIQMTQPPNPPQKPVVIDLLPIVAAIIANGRLNYLRPSSSAYEEFANDCVMLAKAIVKAAS